MKALSLKSGTEVTKAGALSKLYLTKSTESCPGDGEGPRIGESMLPRSSQMVKKAMPTVNNNEEKRSIDSKR